MNRCTQIPEPSYIHFFCRVACIFGMLLAGVGQASGALTYHVAVDGDDASDGTSRAAAFATLQRGVDALSPGDTLIVAPGEYFGSVSIEGLGDSEVDTHIRADIPGTVLIRGDTPLPAFRKVDGFRYVYAAELDFESPVLGVKEIDTLTLFRRVPNRFELDYQLGSFLHDPEANRLYLSTADMGSPAGRAYTAVRVEGDGIEIVDSRRVRVEGLAVTGFKGAGILIRRSTDCRVEECRAYMNDGTGIGINSDTRGRGGAGGNEIAHSVAWGNAGHGFLVREAHHDTLRDSRAFLNRGLGISMYHGLSRQTDNLSWGNANGDYQLKQGGYQNRHEAERTVVRGRWNHESHGDPAKNCLVGSIIGHGGAFFTNCIVLSREPVDLDVEFADPVNHDYRLQSTSRFRGAAVDGGDLGPFPYRATVFYVSTNGNDRADGLSVSNAWASLERASEALVPGATLYLLPGRHAGALTIAVADASADPVSIRGRGAEPATLTEPVTIVESRQVALERLRFTGGVSLEGGGEVSFEQCVFEAATPSPGAVLPAHRVDGLRIVHCEFSGPAETLLDLSGCRRVFLAGNRFDNVHGGAVTIDAPDAILYSDYNGYRRPENAWRLGGDTLPADSLPGGRERHGWALTNGDRPFAGPFERPAGLFRMERKTALRVDGPFIHAPGATSANIEWFSTHAAKVELAWGETPEGEHRRTLNAQDAFRTASDHYYNFSLTGLQPGTRYFVRILSVTPNLTPLEAEAVTDVVWNPDVIAFETPAAYPEPVTYYVAPDGNDAQSGRSRAQALATLYRAAEVVRPGDSVRLSGCVYTQRLYVRATGTPERPITFAAQPGEQVVLDGNRKLAVLLEAFDKHHLRFDRLVLRNAPLTARWSGAFIRLVGGGDIQLERLFIDGRHRGLSPTAVYAHGVRDLVLRNSVTISAFGSSPRIMGCPGFVMEHCVVLHNIIGGMLIDGVPSDKTVIRNTIITDCQANKLVVPVAPIPNPRNRHEKILENNAYFLRPERRVQGTKSMVTGQIPIGEFEAQMLSEGHLIGDPRFAAFQAEDGDTIEGFGPDHLVRVDGDGVPVRALTFQDLFATHPEFLRRGIGLDPKAFEEDD